MNYFLKDIAHYLYSTSGGEMQSYVIVFPNRRARLFFNKYLAELSDKPFWSPAYYTISDLLQQLSGMSIADPLTLVFKLFEVYKRVTHSTESFDDFYFYCEMMLADFDDIDKYLVDPAMLFTNLSDIKTLEGFSDFLSPDQLKTIRQFWETFQDKHYSPEKEQFISLWDSLLEIYRQFNAELDKEGIAYEGKAYRAAVSQIEANVDVPFKNKTVVFVGFNALNRCEEKLFDRLQKNSQSLFFWDFDKAYTDSNLHEAGFFLTKYLPKYPPPQDFVRSEHRYSQQQITTIAVPSNISQSKILGDCLSKFDSNSISLPGNTAIVLADESLLLPAINSLPDSIQKVNISLGYPVVDTPVYSFLSQLTELFANCRNGNSDKNIRFYHRDFFGLMNHFFLRPVRLNENWKKFEKLLQEQNRIYINAADFETDDKLYKLIFRSLKGPKQFGDYLLQIIEEVAHGLLHSGMRTKELKWQLEVLQGLHKVLKRFNELIKGIDIELSFKTVLNLLQKILSGVSVPFSGEPLAGLQVMGILETRTLDFENIIILSMNEGKFPKTGHAPSLIPHNLREGFYLPTVKHQDAIFAYHFYRLLHRAEALTLVYNTKSEGLQKGESSRYISQLRYNSAFNINHLVGGYQISALPRRTVFANKSNKTQAVLQKYLRSEDKYPISPSALNTYINCKLRFYFRYIEGMKEPDDIEEDVEANVFGSILHHAMEVLYEPFRDRVMDTGFIESLKKNKLAIDAAINEGFGEQFLLSKEGPAYQGNLLVIREVIEKYILGILAYDAKHAPLIVREVEGKHYTNIDLPSSGVKLSIGGIIDRIDEIDGRTRIVDYKTGKVDLSFASIEELFDPESDKRNSAVFQTFLYTWMLIRDGKYSKLQPTLFFIREIYKDTFDYTIAKSENRKKNPVYDLSEYYKEFEEQLLKLLEEIFDNTTSYTQTPNVKACGYCPYNAICMRRE